MSTIGKIFFWYKYSFFVCVLIGFYLFVVLSFAEEARVRNVIDGDTIELTDGRLLRYIGVDTPEIRKRQGARWVYSPEPFAEDAKRFNKSLVFDKTVNVEYDVQRYDRYGRLLGYVFVDGVFVNLELVNQGYAKTLPIPPNLKYASLFEESEQQARKADVGIWGIATTKKTDPFVIYTLRKILRKIFGR